MFSTSVIAQKKVDSLLTNISKLADIHRKHANYNSTLGKRNKITKEEDWNDVKKVSTEEQFAGDYTLSKSIQVFGWHPYWLGTAYETYNFSLLSMVSYFSYEVDHTTGGYKDIHHWATTDFVDVAKKKNPNIKVLLTASCFGKSKNGVFLGRKKAQSHFIKTITKLITDKKADGITIDFENIGSKDKTKFTAFIAEIRKEFDKVNPKLIITVTLPAIDWDKAYDGKAIAKYANYVIMMGYEYHYPKSSQAGPIAPLHNSKEWGDYSLDTSIKKYIKQGVPKKQFILAISYFGAIWKTKSTEVKSTNKGFVGYRTYNAIRQSFKKKPSSFDEASTSVYHAYAVANKKGKKQCWFDDTTSLSLKYAYIKKEKLAGVGIWALGFDNGYSDLWHLLKTNFTEAAMEASAAETAVATDAISTDSTATSDSLGGKEDPTSVAINDTNTVAADTTQLLTKVKDMVTETQSILVVVDQFIYSILLTFAIIILAIIIGLVSSLTNKQVRTKIYLYRNVAIGIPLAVLILFNLVLWMTPSTSTSSIGEDLMLLIDGIIIISLIIFFVWYIFREKELP